MFCSDMYSTSVLVQEPHRSKLVSSLDWIKFLHALVNILRCGQIPDYYAQPCLVKITVVLVTCN